MAEEAGGPGLPFVSMQSASIRYWPNTVLEHRCSHHSADALLSFYWSIGLSLLSFYWYITSNGKYNGLK